MSGLTYYRYNNNPKFNNYDSATNFSIFNTNPDGKGLISTIQNNNNTGKLYSDYGFNKNQYIALKLKGYFTPDVSGTWSFKLGDTNPNDDLSYLWIGNNALNPTPQNALGMTYYYSAMQTLKIDLIAGVKYPILIYWGQSWGGLVFSIGIIPPNGQLTYDGSKYYNDENFNRPRYIFSPNELTTLRPNIVIKKWAELNIDTNLNMFVEFNLIITNLSSQWRNIFHFKNNNDDNIRVPASWVAPNDTYLSFCNSTVGNMGNWVPTPAIGLNKETHIIITSN